MYIPKHFEGDEPTGREIMQAHGWALLMTADADAAPVATHLALVWQDDGSPHGSLIGHMARANPHWKLFARGAESLALFWGPHAYVSPTWYTPGVKVPTWNYVTVHAYGRPQVIEDTKGALDALAKLAAVYEGRARRPGASTACRRATPRRRPGASSPSACRSRGSRPSSSSARTATWKTAIASSRGSKQATARTRKAPRTG